MSRCGALGLGRGPPQRAGAWGGAPRGLHANRLFRLLVKLSSRTLAGRSRLGHMGSSRKAKARRKTTHTKVKVSL